MPKKNSHEILACFPVMFNELLFGLGSGWVTPMLVKLQTVNSAVRITEEQASWMASMPFMGRVGGPMVSPFIIDNFGRKYSTILITVTLFLISFSQIFIRDFYSLCFTRLMFGVIDGVADVASSIYVTENCSPKTRVVVSALLPIIEQIGSFVELLIAGKLTYESTAYVNMIISACALGSLYYCTETPSFLVMKNLYNKAEKNLAWLRGGCGLLHENFNELENLKMNIHEEKLKNKSFRTIFSSATNMKCLTIVLSLAVIVVMTGSSAIHPYMMVIFQSDSNYTAYQFTILNRILDFVSKLISPYVASRTNRKTLLIVCFALIGLCHLGTSVLMFLHHMQCEILFYPWLIFISVTSYHALKAMALPALFIIKTEILPLSIRAIGASMAVVVSAIAGFGVAKTFQPTSSNFGMEMNFFFYSLASLVFSIFVYSLVPNMQKKMSNGIPMSLEESYSGK